jgi:hypothetical protein
MELEARFSIPAARFASESCRNVGPPKNRGRRECRVHDAPTALRAKQKKTHARSTQVRRNHSGTPCAMALRLTPRSPRGTGLVSPRRLIESSIGLDPSVGGSGPHGLTVRFQRTSSARQQRPSHPASRSVTIGLTPLLLRRDAGIKPLFLLFGKRDDLRQINATCWNQHDVQEKTQWLLARAPPKRRAVGWAKARTRRAHRNPGERGGGHASLCPPYKLSVVIARNEATKQ